MREEIRNRFSELKVTGQRTGISAAEKDFKLIKYLSELIDGKEIAEFEEVGFAYWNISDSYALLRKPAELYENHLKFYNLIKSNDRKYLFWAVSDATQKLTLESGGYREFWWGIYDEACEKNAEAEPFVEFTAHKAAMYTTAAVAFDAANVSVAADRFERFLSRTEGVPEHRFYTSVFKSLGAKHGVTSAKELIELFGGLLDGLQLANKPSGFLTGEWQSFTTLPSKRTQSEQGIAAVINALVDIGESRSAGEIYRKAVTLGLPKNLYIEKRLG